MYIGDENRHHSVCAAVFAVFLAQCRPVSVWRFTVGQSVWYLTGHHHLQCAGVCGSASFRTGRVRGQLHCHGGRALHLWVSAVNP